MKERRTLFKNRSKLRSEDAKWKNERKSRSETAEGQFFSKSKETVSCEKETTVFPQRSPLDS